MKQNNKFRRTAAVFLTAVMLTTLTAPLALPISASQQMTQALLLIDNSKPNSASNPYLVSSAADLNFIAQTVKGGSDLSGVYFCQVLPINLQGVTFEGIGTAATPFRGSYEGSNQTISGYSLEGVDSVGLFNYVGNGAVIRNVKASGKISIASPMNGVGGGIVGSAVGAEISGCTFEGSVTVSGTAAAYAGGIVGRADSTKLTSCTNNGTIAALGGAMMNSAGGIAGSMKGGSAAAVVNKGAVGASDGTQSAAAGIVGSVSGTVIESANNSGSISVSTGERIAECLIYSAGIAGFGDSSASSVKNSKNSGAVSASSSSQLARQYAAGIAAGAGRISVSGCENTGSVKADNGGMIYVGGISASTASAITSCRTYGASISASNGTYAAIGGIAGESTANITDSSAGGNLTLTSIRASGGYSSPANIGGIVGTSSGGNVSGCTSSMIVKGTSGSQAVIYGGGIAGAASGKLINCASTGSISLDGAQDIAGGIVGMMNHSTKLYNSYNTGSVKGGFAGHVAGYLAGSTANCYSIGTVSGSGQDICGIRDSSASAEYCYWYAPNVNAQLSASYNTLSSGRFALIGDSSGTLYSLVGGVDVYGTKAASLLEALNAWTASGTHSNEASYWVTPTAGTNGGFPVFGEEQAQGNEVVINTSAGGKLTSDKKYASAGASVTLTVTPDTGFRLKSLTINGSAVMVNNTVRTYSFSMPNGKVTVNAVFERTSVVGAGQYYITVGSMTNGTVKVDKSIAKKGETVTVTVTPSTGYRLQSGSLKYNDTEIRMSSSGYSFVMPDENVTITAKFMNGRGFTIKAAANLENGTIIPDRETAVAGERVTFRVVPDEGFEIKPNSVTVNGEIAKAISDGVYSFEMASVHTTLRASFIPDADRLYNIEITEAENGTFTVDKTEAKAGETVEVTLSPSEGYRYKNGTLKFNGKKIEEVSGGFSFEMPKEDVKITVEFEKYVSYKLTVTKTENGKITLNRTEAGDGDTVVVTVTPIPGYRLVENSLKYNSIVMNKSGSAYSFVMPASNVTVTAKFELIPGTVTSKPTVTEPTKPVEQKYVISLGTVKNGTVLVNTTSAVAGTRIEVTPKPNSGYQLKSATLKYNGNQIPLSGSGYSFVMPSAEVKITAEFEKIADVASYSVKLKSSYENGSISVSPTNAPAGTTVTVNVSPDSGYQLRSGSLKVNGTSIIPTGSAYRFVMPAENVTIDAEFEEARHVKYSISIAEMNGGAVTADKTAAEPGERIMLNIIPDSGYRLKDGSLSYNDIVLITSGTSCYFIMPESDVKITAAFEHTGIAGGTADNAGGGYNVSVVSHAGGRIVKAVSASDGDISFDIIPDDGFTVSDVIIDNSSVGAVNSYTFEAIKGDHTIEAFFAELETEADAMEQLKDMMLSAGIIIVASIIILTALVLLIVSIVKVVSGSNRKRRRTGGRSRGKNVPVQPSPEEENVGFDFEYDENGQAIADEDGDTAQFETVKTDDGNNDR